MALWNPDQEDQLRRLYQAHQQQLAAKQQYDAEQAAAKKKKGGRGGSLTSFISELGGTGGAIGGAATGAAIGSIVPGIGTAVGGVVGGIAGGFAGGFGGSAVEQKIRDDNVDWGKAGVEGAFSAIPGGVGKSTKVIAKGAAEKGFTRDVADLFKPKVSGRTSTVANAGSDLRAANRGVVTGGKMEGRSASLRPKEADEINDFLNGIDAKGSVKNQVNTVSAAQKNAADSINSIVTNKAKPVTSNDIYGSINRVKDKIIGRNGDGIGGFNPDTHGSIANDYAAQMANIKDSKGWLAFKRSLDDDINYSRTNQSVDPKREQIAQAFRNEAKQQLEKLHPEIVPHNQTYGAAENAMNVLLKNANPKGFKVGAGFVDPGGRGVGGGMRQAATDLAGRALEAPANSGIGAKVGDLFATATTPGARQVYGQAAASALSPNGAAQPTDDPMAALGLDGGAEAQAPMINSWDDLNSALSGGGGDPMASASGLQYGSQDLMNTAFQALQKGDSASYKLYADAAARAADMEAAQAKGAGGAKSLNSTASGVIADTTTGLQSLGQLSGKIAASNANFPGVGKLRTLNPFDTGSQNLQADIATARQIVGKALEGGVLRKEDETKYKAILPTVNDTDANAQYKIQQLIGLISSRLEEYKRNLGAGDGGMDINNLFSQGAGGQYATGY